MPEIRPTDGSAIALNAAGEKSRSVSLHAAQRSVKVTVTLLPWSGMCINVMEQFVTLRMVNLQVAVTCLQQMGFLFGLTPL